MSSLCLFFCIDGGLIDAGPAHSLKDLSSSCGEPVEAAFLAPVHSRLRPAVVTIRVAVGPQDSRTHRALEKGHGRSGRTLQN